MDERPGAHAELRILDRIERLEAGLRGELGKVDERVRGLELTCERIENQAKADRSRVSRETKRADEDDKDADARLRKLEHEVAVHKGERRAGRAVSAGIAGSVVAFVEAVKAWW